MAPQHPPLLGPPPFTFHHSLFTKGGARVVVDSTSLEWLRGSTIGFEDEMVGQRFVVMNNPNSAAGCGCGASFAPKEEALGLTGADDDSDSDDEA